MIPEIKRILFTSDLSENSRYAFQYALTIAGQFCADLIFLHVLEDVPMGARAFLDEAMIEKIRQQTATTARSTLIGKRREMSLLESELDRFCRTASEAACQAGEKRVESNVRVVEGNVIESILAAADEARCDAIVMGSKRRGALAEAMLGSVVKGILRRSRKLVIVAPPASGEASKK